MRKHIKLFNQFKINETSEFNFQRSNPDSGMMSVHVDNPELSVNAFDKHEDAIRAASSKLTGLLKSLSSTPQFAILKSRLNLDAQNITSLKILRITESNNINYNVYVSFVIKDEEYWGEVENILDRYPTFKSEVFKDTDLVLTKEWVIKIKGLIIKILKKWLNPENGKYKLLNDKAHCININTGRISEITKGDEVEVIRSYDNKIVIKYKNDYYNLTGDNYIYFNYWFIKCD